jgi:SAM-dependent methyltransferase
MNQTSTPRAPYRNAYVTELTDEQIAAGVHREAVGGRWDEIGRWQFELLVAHGLQPNSRLLDVGCGALRGGIHFIRYLEPGNYYGLDMNASLIKAGREVELVQAGLTDRDPHLLVDGDFNLNRFGTTFSFALAQSVFSHLPANVIHRCLVQIAAVLEPGGRFYATFFEAPTRHHLAPINHPSGIVTTSDNDPFHYHFSWFSFLAAELPLTVTNLGDWQHPRSQHVLEFVRL